MRDSTVAIVGLGLMGGSLALALRAKNACHKIIAIDSDPDTRARASERGVETYAALDAIVSANLIVLATPVRAILELMPSVGGLAREGAIVMDLGSTKREIVSAMEQLPEYLQVIGGHPMCGKETFGWPSADPNLFANATFVLTPLSRTSSATIKLVSSLASCLDARPLLLAAEQHDRIVALTSHLPYTVAAALVLAASELVGDDDLFSKLAASGFRDTSRLAASDVKMMLDVLLTNGENVASGMRAYSEQFAHLADLIEKQDEDALRALLERAAAKRKSIPSKL